GEDYRGPVVLLASGRTRPLHATGGTGSDQHPALGLPHAEVGHSERLRRDPNRKTALVHSRFRDVRSRVGGKSVRPAAPGVSPDPAPDSHDRPSAFWNLRPW